MVNRCFESLERADISQALDTAIQPPRQNLASLCLAHSSTEAGCWVGNIRSYIWLAERFRPTVR